MASGKQHIRKAVLRNRRLLDERTYAQRNKLLCVNADDFIDRTQPAFVHCFLPIVANREPDTWPIIERLVERGIQPVVSSTDFETETMSHFLYTEILQFENDRFGIPTPVDGETADLQKVDLVFIPLLAVDSLGNRVGYGKGYYDRLLPDMRPDVIKVGLNLCPTFDAFPFAEVQDVPVKHIITPFEIIDCKG
ncbi:MAG: 5-formyltetrahydrofolate cyclo-ligase [Cyclobacteriaceae bacterium]